MPEVSDDTLLVYGGQILTATGIVDDGWVLLGAGQIIDLGRGTPRPGAASILNASGKMVAPGFIDIHTHGGNGADFSDRTVEAFAIATKFHAQHGVTALQATTT